MSSFIGMSGSQNQSSGNSKEYQPEGAKLNSLPSLSIGVLQEIGRRCNSRVCEILNIVPFSGLVWCVFDAYVWCLSVSCFIGWVQAFG